MIQSTPAVDAAFAELAAALDAESAEMKKVGGELFHAGAPRQAQSLLLRAKAHEALRGQIASLHDQWKSGIPIERPTPAVPFSMVVERGPGLIRNIPGMGVSQAAQFLGAKPAKVRAWLEAGTLKGYQRVSGTWKITRVDLLEFEKRHRDLLSRPQKGDDSTSAAGAGQG